jgi:O-antigen/teichoic acid export membrane protein
MTERRPDPGRLRGLVVRGVGWVMASQIVIQAVGFATTIVVARFLTPRELGLAAMALVFSTLGLLISDLGLGVAVIQRRELSDVDRSTAFWATTALGLIVTGAAIGLSGPIADLYGEERVQPLFAVLSLSFLLTALGTTQGALLIRELRFRSLELRTMVATTTACAAAIVAAVAGLGPWAIVIQHLVNTGLSTVLLWRSSEWRPGLAFSRRSLRSMVGFSGYVFASGLFDYLHRNADNFLIGRYRGATELGAYAIAYNVMLVPLSRLARPIQGVFFPAMSRIRDRDEIGAVWVRISRIVAAVAVPAFLGLIVLAADFVHIVFGERWHEATPVLQILAVVGLLQSLDSQISSVLLALDRPRVLFRIVVVATVVSVASFAIGLRWGIEGVATAYALASLAILPYNLWLTGRVVSISVLRFLLAFSGVAQAAIVMGLAVWGARELLLEVGVPTGPRLTLCILAGAAVYLPLCAWRAPEVADEFRRLWGRRCSAREGA